ncbi:Conserved_hypothetical protein [Hexamita inflata]|uniref:Leucine-rich repeat domain-containing protein n=1 Tax=Hexamita inflata TaxID=28002 RepID=A0AA86UIV2_9EUKA|nr:Conserved hypothetical protein [Hexamita inflata]
MQRNKIQNVSVLGKMQNLKTLDLGRNKIDDISALKDLKLTELSLWRNNIKDIRYISSTLIELSLDYNQLTDISA